MPVWALSPLRCGATLRQVSWCTPRLCYHQACTWTTCPAVHHGGGGPWQACVPQWRFCCHMGTCPTVWARQNWRLPLSGRQYQRARWSMGYRTVSAKRLPCWTSQAKRKVKAGQQVKPRKKTPLQALVRGAHAVCVCPDLVSDITIDLGIGTACTEEASVPRIKHSGKGAYCVSRLCFVACVGVCDCECILVVFRRIRGPGMLPGLAVISPCVHVCLVVHGRLMCSEQRVLVWDGQC